MVRSIGVVGAGTMGRGIAELAARGGFTVTLHDAAPGAAESAIAAIGDALSRDVDKGRLQKDQAGAILAAIAVGDIAAIAGCDLIIEAIVEKLDVKQALVRDIDRLAAKSAILVTNTSSLSVATIADAIANPGRFAGLHFFNPPTRMRIVEIVRGAGTSAETVTLLEAVADQLGQRAFVVADTPGFLVNHIGRALTGEALRMLGEGIADPRTLDRIARGALHFKMGPFELLDLTGIDVSAEVTEQIWKGFGEEPRFKLAPIARQRVAAGLLGRKTGRGFYEYDQAGKALVPAASAIAAAPIKLRLAGLADDRRNAIEALLSPELLTEDRSAVDLVAPIGTSVAVQAEHLGLDPVRTVGIDAQFTDLVTIAGTPRTEPALLAGAAASFATSGREVAIVGDGPGMPAQRIATMMVLIACDAAERGVGSPADIDAAAKLALAYPKGPMELGDSIGALRVSEIAASLFALTGDERWRPSRWLAEHVRTSRSLTDSPAPSPN